MRAVRCSMTGRCWIRRLLCDLCLVVTSGGEVLCPMLGGCRLTRFRNWCFPTYLRKLGRVAGWVVGYITTRLERLASGRGARCPGSGQVGYRLPHAPLVARPVAVVGSVMYSVLPAQRRCGPGVRSAARARGARRHVGCRGRSVFIERSGSPLAPAWLGLEPTAAAELSEW